MSKRLTMANARRTLQSYWGHTDFRDVQAEAVKHVLQGSDVLLVARTGMGKSAVFQVPAIMAEGTAVVVSPLISLMHDQVHDLEERGIPAAYINSTQPTSEQQRVFKRFVEGEYDLLYVSPERLRTKGFRDAVSKATVSYVVIDEAHCIASDGHDFRPAYMLIPDAFSDAARRPPIVAVTATATVETAGEIAESLRLKDDHVRVLSDPIRPNFRYHTLWAGRPWTNLSRTLDAMVDPRKGRHLVYAASRKVTEYAAKTAADSVGQSNVAFYHAGMPDTKRSEVQRGFKSGDIPVVCATSAFGMGIDVPDIRTVIHFGIRDSLESYTQEIGRGGRDGGPTVAVLIHNPKAAQLQRRFVEEANPQYYVYRMVWGALHAVLDEGDCRTVPEGKIKDLIMETFDTEVSIPDISAALQVLEAYGAVSRGYRAPTTYYTLGNTRLPSTGPEAKLANAVASRVNRTGYPMMYQAGPIAAETGLSRDTLSTALANLLSSGALVEAEQKTNKTIQIDHYHVPLEQVVTEDMVEDKRARDHARLDAMVDYAGSDDPVGTIRRYFGLPNVTDGYIVE